MDTVKAAEALRQSLEEIAALKYEQALRAERRAQQNPDGGLLAFIRYFWHILEPATPFVEGWALECLCGHLEAITRKDRVFINGEERQLNRLLVNCPPGMMKSLCVNTFWPAFEWGPMGLPHLRYVNFSYAAELTERDNQRFRDLITSPEYQAMWGHVFKITGDGKIRITNDKMGFKFASSILGVGTGERGDRCTLDDPHKLKGTAESPDARKSVVQWVREAMSNRLNDLRESAIVIIMQRLHMEDTSGAIMEHHADEYCHLIIPMEYESGRHFTHLEGWADPREDDGELAWPERYAARELASFKRNSYLWAGQYQQRPVPRGGGILKDDWWQPYEVPKSKTYDFIPIFTLASLDTAFKEKQENDYSALTVWVVYDDPKTKDRRVILTDAWRKRLPLHGTAVEKYPQESEQSYIRRASQKWGLIEWVNFTCSKRHVNRLIIEDASRGTDVQNEIRRVYKSRDWGVQLVQPVGDKWSRVASVVDLFTDNMIWAPGNWDGEAWNWRDWAAMVIDECSVFPRGPNDDLVDTVAMALKHLRECGYLVRREERLLAEQLAAAYKTPLKPLYEI